MNISIGVLATIEIVSSLFTGVVILWLTHKILMVFAKRKIGLDDKINIAYSIFMAAILFSVGYTVSTVVQPLVSYFRILSASSESTFSLSTSFMLYGGLYVAISYILSLILSFIGVILYVFLTPLNEFEEIKNNNIGVALVVGTIIITLNLITHSGIGLLIESFLPYPELPPTGF